jgi:hypothetical protein
VDRGQRSGDRGHRTVESGQWTEDKGTEDKGTEDKGTEDKGTEDKGTEDKGTEDRGQRDRGTVDSGQREWKSEIRQILLGLSWAKQVRTHISLQLALYT